MTRTTVPRQASSAVIDDYVRSYLGDHQALYQLDLAALQQADPNIIVSQQLCDVCAVSTDEVAAMLGQLPSKPRLVDLQPNVLDDVLADCLRVAEALGIEQQGQRLVDSLKTRINRVAERSSRIPERNKPRVAMLEWLIPPFNSGHWNPELVELAGGRACLGLAGQPSRTLAWSDVRESQPDILFIACCGFSEQRTAKDLALLADEPEWIQLRTDIQGRILWTDANAYFSRPGPRLVDSLEALAHALHPDIHPPPESSARVHFLTSA